MSGRPIILGRDEGDTAWMCQGNCYGAPPGTMYPTDIADEPTALAVCAGCPVIDTCRDYALRNNERHGVWGGLQERERAKLRRKLVREGRLPRASGHTPEPIIHGSGTAAWKRCRGVNGDACTSCKRGHAIESANRKERRAS